MIHGDRLCQEGMNVEAEDIIAYITGQLSTAPLGMTERNEPGKHSFKGETSTEQH